MNCMNNELQDLKKENESLKSRIYDLEKNFTALTTQNKTQDATQLEVEQLKMNTRERDQYERNRNIEVHNVDQAKNENLRDVVGKLATAFGIRYYRPEMIDAAHRLPSKNKDRPPAIIIQFKFRDSRDAWINEKKTVVTNDQLFANSNGTRIYINENMTPYYKDLFWKTKKHARENNIKFVWFLRGKIMVRIKEGDKRIYVCSKE